MEQATQPINHTELKAKLNKFLSETGIKQEVLSKKLGFSATTLANYKCGNFNLSREKADQLINFIERTEMIWKTPL